MISVMGDPQKEKQRIESEMKLAKVKYYKREMDEETFKKIIAEQEKQLIEVETKIRENMKLTAGGKKLEDVTSKKSRFLFKTKIH